MRHMPLAPALLIFTGLFAAPLAYFFAISFWTVRARVMRPDFSLRNYAEAVTEYGDVLLYTLLVSGVGSNAINYSVYSKMGYADKDFAHVSLLATGPNVLVAHPDFPAKNFTEFLALTKANAGKYSHASSGSGSSGHLAMEMLKQAAGLQLTHVPYKGGGPAIIDTIGGQVPLLFINQDNASR